MQTIRKYLPGMAVCLAIAIPSWLLGKLVPVIGGPVFSIVIGMVIALFWTPGAACKPGTAKVTAIAKGAKHPYHLIKQPGGGSTVYGWVNAADVQAVGSGTTAPKMRVGAKVKYSGPLYRDSNGGGQGKTVNGTYTVKYYYPGRKCGVHIDGLGWVPESGCTVIG